MVHDQIKIGIMSGRLSEPINNQIQAFPANSWKDEFQKAQICGFDSIEWVFDLQPNPILDNDGLNQIKLLSDKHKIQISSVCADYFMKKMLFNVSEYDLQKNLIILQKLIQQCYRLEIEILEIPFVDSSSLKTKNDENQIVINLQKIINLAISQNVKITLETDLHPTNFKNLLEKFNNSNIGANYDSGNSTALGYDPKVELQTLKPWLSNIHIKDRFYHGTTVPLGNGDTNFDLVFSTLAKINYNGQLIIQGAREDHNMIEPQVTCLKYLEFVRNYAFKHDLISRPRGK